MTTSNTAKPNALHPPAPMAADIPAPPDVAAPPADATKLPSGLAFKVLTPGTGTVHPTIDATVSAQYTGWTTDGKMFDSSTKHGGQPATFPLRRVIPGWTEVVQQMTQGEKIRTWIPQELAYQGKVGPPAGTLVFDIELVSFKEGLPPPATPADVAAAPADAFKTASGIASKVLKKGTGTVHPGPTSKVEVHYSGWTTDGKMFDSSVQRGQTITFPLNGVIPGWTEGVQLMVEGEKRRLWIPGKLAYDGQPGRPQGTLVFDVELIKIVPDAAPKAAPVK
jgi:FKBP-type peptidyl-prolyl cis-trans isomerase